MAGNKFIVCTQRNKIFEYEADSFIEALECYITEVLGFNKRLKISQESWTGLMESTMANSLRVACLNGLCKFRNDTITNVIKKSFAYPFEESKDGISYGISPDYEYAFVIGQYNSEDTSSNLIIADTYGGLPVTSIAAGAFNNCKNLIEIMIPESISEIEAHTFDSCTSLRTIYFEGTQEQWNEIVKEDIPASITVYYNHKYAHSMGAWIDNGNGTHTSYCQNKYPEGIPSCVYRETADCIYGDWIIETPATCSQEGLKTQTCEVCSGKETESISKLAHTEGKEEIENIIEATCLNVGSHQVVVYCSVCREELSRETVVTDAILSHVPSAATIENKLEADCKNSGSYDEVVYCSACNTELSRTKKTIPATGAHVYTTEIERKEATCTEAGYKIMACDCGESERVEIEALGHSAGEAVTENVTEADCENNGSYDTVVYCTVCDAELSRVTTTINALGHTKGEAVIENNVDPTCTDDGSYDSVVYCSVCGEELSREKIIVAEAFGHDYYPAEELIASTCITKGQTVYRCNHDYSHYYVQLDDYKPSYHEGDLVIIGRIEPTCDEPGYTGDEHWSCCNALEQPGESIDPLGCLPELVERHYIEIPTCSTTGSCYDETHCSRCGKDTSTGDILELPTNPTAHVDNNNDGICDLCGEILLNIEEIGTCGEQLTYTRFDDGTLYIRGEGTMYDYTETGDAMSPFRGGNITQVFIMPGVSSIGNYAFYGCDEIVSVELSEDLTHIGYNAFQDCVRLTSIDMSKCRTLAKIPYAAFRYCSSLTSVSFPESLRIIDQFAFDHCIGFISVELPEGLEEIGRNSFTACTNLVSINIPSTCKVINNLAFATCESLISIELPKSCALIANVFAGCTNLTEVILPEDLTKIGEGTFAHCSSLSSIEIPESVKSIESNAFYECSSLASINLSKLSLLSGISGSVFQNCTKLTTVKLPENLQCIYTKAFSGCSSLTSITLPEGITKIASSAFEKCSNLTTINFPDSITSIEAYAFDGCSSLTSVDLSKNTNIQVPGSYIFRNCSSLATVKLPETLTRVRAYMFYNCKCLASVEVPELVTSIENHAFCYCNSLVSINLPEGLVEIGEHAFYECRSLTSVVLPETLTEIGEYAFESCVKLASVHLPSTLTIIKKYTFNACHELTTINLPETLTEIGEMAFDYCKSLVSMVIPENVTSIGKEAFRCCFSLESITLPTNLQSLGESAFISCSALTSIALPAGLTKIEGYTFQRCTSLKMITIPVSIKSIGTSAFNSCTALITVNYSGTEYQWMDLTNSMGANNTPLTTAIVNYQYNI